MWDTLSCPALIDLLKHRSLLEPTQLQELSSLAGLSSTPKSLCQLILERDWLTSYQINQLLSGRIDALFLGQYLIQAKLGEGGMGQVFRSLDRTMGRVVALKVIRPDILNSPQAVERFLKEIRAAASLDHPNIIRAYHAGCLDTSHFLVMEYAEGKDLHRRLRQDSPLPVASVCDWMRQTSLALQHIADRGMVHRDVKPMNLLLTTQGTIKLLDMGLARPHALTGAARPPEATRQGSMMGTADYVAPEQIVDASSVDIRADLYSLGCTLYHLLAGLPPFPGDDLGDKLRRHLSENPEPLEKFRPETPAAVVNLVRRLLRKNPKERPQKPLEVAQALEACLGSRPTDIPASGPPPRTTGALSETIEHISLPLGRRRRWGVWISAVGILAAAVVILFGWIHLTRVEPQPAPKDGGGQMIADAKLPDRNPPATKEKEPPKLPLKTPATPPEKNSKTLPEFVPAKTVPVPPRQAEPWKERLPWQPAELVQVLGDERGRHWGSVSLLTWSGDGRRLASSGADGIRLWDAATLRELGAFKEGQQQPTVIALSADGKRLALSSYSGDGQVWDVAGAAPRKESMLKAAGSLRGNSLTGLQFSPDGASLTGLTSKGGVLRWSTKRLDSLPEEIVAVDDVTGRSHCIARTGAQLAFLRSESNMTKVLTRRLDDAEAKEQPVGELLGSVRSLALSPDGRIVAAAMGPDHKETSLAPSGLRVWSLTRNPAREDKYNRQGGMGQLTFSADGTRLAAACGTSVLVWQITDAGLSDPVEFKSNGGPVLALAFSPSGNVLGSASDGAVRLWDVTAPPPEFDAVPWKSHDLAFSPDGKRLASALRVLPTLTKTEIISRIRVQDLDTPDSSREVDFQGYLLGVSFSPRGDLLLAFGVTSNKRESLKSKWGVMEVRDARTLKLLREIGFDDNASAIDAQILADANVCIVLTRNQSRVTFRRFDTTTWKELDDLQRPSPFGHAVLSADGRVGLTRETGNEPGVGKTDEAIFWDLRSPNAEAIREMKRFTIRATSPYREDIQSLSRDGSRIAVVSIMREVEVWDTWAGRRLGSGKGSFAKVTKVSFSPDGTLVASLEDDNRITIWRTDGSPNLKHHREPWRFPGPIHAISFDPSGHFLATGNGNGTISILRVREPNAP